MTEQPDPAFFARPADWRGWLEENYDTATELWVGFHRRSADPSGMTWSEAVDEALCLGWVDGQRRKVDDERYMIRFTPRKSGSVWSAVNTDRVGQLRQQGRMRPAGENAFAQRSESRAGSYSYEQDADSVAFDPEQERRLRADEAAWTFFTSQPASYRKAATWWVVGAKKEQTRAKRFEQLLSDSANGRTVPPLTRRR
ncbi:YdeI/OmpD-associated family protein [Saccharomonospora halophila]|uniref:YdeI/OmpD-associated family protein n=1 Tax=Saccharomonospora halophila TaxID=129922 RepID=UPI00036DEFBD|nr:YdeI/OmpD-associated family protein [Saccharomonospora halophila]